jgi:hypothetical protein
MAGAHFGRSLHDTEPGGGAVRAQAVVAPVLVRAADDRRLATEAPGPRVRGFVRDAGDSLDAGLDAVPDDMTAEIATR